MESFPVDFTLADMQRKIMEEVSRKNDGFTPKLRQLFHDNITKALADGFKAALITVDQPENYPQLSRKIVSAEVAKRFPGALYAHCQLERLDIDHFESVGVDGAQNFEFLVILDPDFKSWPVGGGKKQRIEAIDGYSLCKTKIGC